MNKKRKGFLFIFMFVYVLSIAPIFAQSYNIIVGDWWEITYSDAKIRKYTVASLEGTGFCNVECTGCSAAEMAEPTASLSSAGVLSSTEYNNAILGAASSAYSGYTQSDDTLTIGSYTRPCKKLTGTEGGYTVNVWIDSQSYIVLKMVFIAQAGETMTQFKCTDMCSRLGNLAYIPGFGAVLSVITVSSAALFLALKRRKINVI